MADNIIGVEDVKKLINEVGKVSARVLTTASKTGAKIALADAKRNVYNGFFEQTGTLKRSLRIWSQKKKPKNKRVYIMGPDSTGWYAHFIDYGFTTRNGNYMPGNRFLRNAIDNNRESIKNAQMAFMYEKIKGLR
jgi:HK97 gp10 family phage protein